MVVQWLLLPIMFGLGRCVTVLSWSVHWQCGSYPSCRTVAEQRLLELTSETDPDFVVAIELEKDANTPINLTSAGLGGYASVPGSCVGAPGHAGDAVALGVAPGYTVVASGGGCLNAFNESARAFAVALVTPPAPVEGCAELCVVGLHAPHGYINNGSDIVAETCGEAALNCAIAAGDWNVFIDYANWPADFFEPVPAGFPNVSQVWTMLVPSTTPLTVQTPDRRTCCYPDNLHWGYDDHLVTNVKGVTNVTWNVFPYQVMEGSLAGNDTEEHKPLMVRFDLPLSQRSAMIISV
uniref:Endonuclease/exonuclease/phosphatase domain-containing protein n=1 Tax=Noctiluca scintillans TaxID=2966 RepID=A0A7S0ZP53_NOCSC|mmetsp:Transcript_12263/g.33660  ORF Transcript_12263/g.33660 Transcript_12263/m.33660 type:complete len:294 (+) Transcript_12263:66-947(+)|eukprot:CAMPEP_0194481570 /NCGR_PEP_ID=MMETSP0253-20130528/3933_1 /TAXON_ID=2966 /ORGANISM="Noctiluca scintillans" /LENGTH=293 /DNA_ID=CAMNT_0039321061 /DNA_START=62 /DNA_END=943 /DNA_ORIENTATION=+